jgi:hypothetical protein
MILKYLVDFQNGRISWCGALNWRYKASVLFVVDEKLYDIF